MGPRGRFYSDINIMWLMLIETSYITGDVSRVTPRPKRVYGMCNRMCTKGFLNYFSAIIEFLKVVLRVTL